MVGKALTVRVEKVLLLHPLLSVPVTVKVAVRLGLALTEFPVAAFRLPAGLHTKEEAPLTVNATELPAQIDRSAEAESVGNALTVTAVDAVLLQLLPSVPVTVKVVERDKLKVLSAAPAEELRLTEGLHKYVEAPDTLSAVELPVQMD